MADFQKTIGLKEKAEEDIYFARLDRERIRHLHEEQATKDTFDGVIEDETPATGTASQVAGQIRRRDRYYRFLAWYREKLARRQRRG